MDAEHVDRASGLDRIDAIERADAVDVALAVFAAYRDQDVAAAMALLDADLVFTSPQDDHIDRSEFLRTCFPTASRFRTQTVTVAREVEPGVVMLRYTAEPVAGPPFSNVELITVRDGRIREIRVYFGGPE